LIEVARGKRKKVITKKRKRTEEEVAQAVAEATDRAERGGRGSGIQIGERHFHLEGRQLGTEATEQIEEQLAEQKEESPDQTQQTPPCCHSGQMRAQVTPRPEGQRCGGHSSPIAHGQPPIEHFDLRGATT
jgi:hypothetical protein